MVSEVLETRGHRDDGEAVGVEFIGLAGELERAEVVVLGVLEGGGRAGRTDDAHVEAGVVRDEHVLAREGRQVGELLDPGRGRVHVVLADAVNPRVPLEEVVEAHRRADQPAGPIDDAAVADLHEPDGAGGGSVRVGGLEVDGGEVDGHAPASHAPPTRS